MPSTQSGPAGREYTIGDVAQLLGVSSSWIKQRESKGVLPPPRRTKGGHRTYNADDLRSIRDIAVREGFRVPEPGRSSAQKMAEVVSGRIALINQKGGVGKTTLTHNLGFALGERGVRTLLVDLDRQYNLTTCCGIDIRDEREKGLGYALLRATKKEDPGSIVERSLVSTSNACVDLLPNNIVMFDAERELRDERIASFATFLLQNILRRLSDRYDVVLIDCPPDLGLLTTNGLIAADSVIVPVDHHLALQGLEQLQEAIDMVDRYQHPLGVLGVLLNRFDARTRYSHSIEEQLRGYYADRLFGTRISTTSRIMEATAMGQSLLEYDPRNSVAGQFRSVADEVIERLRSLRSHRRAA